MPNPEYRPQATNEDHTMAVDELTKQIAAILTTINEVSPHGTDDDVYWEYVQTMRRNHGLPLLTEDEVREAQQTVEVTLREENLHSIPTPPQRLSPSGKGLFIQTVEGANTSAKKSQKITQEMKAVILIKQQPTNETIFHFPPEQLMRRITTHAK